MVKVLFSKEKILLVFPLLLIVGLGCFLRVNQLARHSLYNDEIAMFRRIKNEKITDIFTQYTSLKWPRKQMSHLWYYPAISRSTLQKNRFWCRFPSVLFGTLTIGLVFLLALELFSFEVGLVSAFLLAISPMHIFYSQKIRYPISACFFSLLSLYFLFKLVKRRHFEIRLMLGFLLVNLVNFLNYFPIAVVIILIELSFLFLFFGKSVLGRLIKKEEYIKSLLVLSIILAALLTTFSFLNHLGTSKMMLPQLRFTLFQFNSNPTAPFSIDFFYRFLGWLSGGEELAVLVYLIFFVVGIFALGGLRQHDLFILFLLSFIIPFLIMFTVKIKVHIAFRHYIFLLPLYLILVAAGLCSFSEKFFNKFFRLGYEIERAIFLLALGAVFFGGFALEEIKRNYDWKWYIHYRGNNINFYRLKSILQEEVKPGDVVTGDDWKTTDEISYVMTGETDGERSFNKAQIARDPPQHMFYKSLGLLTSQQKNILWVVDYPGDQPIKGGDSIVFQKGVEVLEEKEIAGKPVTKIYLLRPKTGVIFYAKMHQFYEKTGGWNLKKMRFHGKTNWAIQTGKFLAGNKVSYLVPQLASGLYDLYVVYGGSYRPGALFTYSGKRRVIGRQVEERNDSRRFKGQGGVIKFNSLELDGSSPFALYFDDEKTRGSPITVFYFFLVPVEGT